MKTTQISAMELWFKKNIHERKIYVEKYEQKKDHQQKQFTKKFRSKSKPKKDIGST